MKTGPWKAPTRSVQSNRAPLWALLSVVPFAWIGCSSGDASSKDDSTKAEPTYKIINVEVHRIVPQPFAEYIRLTGVAKAHDDITISAEEPGRVTRVVVDRGTRVRRGQLLFKIDDRLLRSQIATAEAESAFAADAYERQKAVWDNKIGTELAYLERKNAAAVTAARLEGLRTRLDNTRLTSPIDGVLDARYVDEGEMVAMGTAIGRVLNSQMIKIEVGVPERFAGDVQLGGRVLIDFDVLKGMDFEGEIEFVGSAVDPGNRTFPIEIQFENPQGLIKPEMIANTRVVRHQYDAAIVVPEQAVRYTENGFVAYVAVETEAGTIAEERHVDVGPSYADRIVIEKGLQAGDRLITRGHLQVAQGSHVEIVSSSEGMLP
jgi:RND family efflux transporter MFP subunit